MRFGSLVNPAISRVFIVRLINVLLSLIFALWYSKLMGLEIRSLLSFILLSNTLLTYMLIGSFASCFRSYGKIENSGFLISNLIIFSIFLSLLIALVQLNLIYLFSNQVGIEFPTNALRAVIFYSVLSALNVTFTEILSSLESLIQFIAIETLVIITQLICFLCFVLQGEFSFFVSVLISFSLSYLLSIFATLILLLDRNLILFPTREGFRILFSRDTLVAFPRFLLNSVIQRFDKLLIPFFYQSTLLAQVTTLASALGVFRFIPESETRINVNEEVYRGGPSKTKLFTRTMVSALFSLILVSALVSIYLILGPEWVPSLGVVLALAYFEILTWQYQRSLTRVRQITKKRTSTSAILGAVSSLFVVLPFAMSHFSYAEALVIASIPITIAYISLHREGQ